MPESTLARMGHLSETKEAVKTHAGSLLKSRQREHQEEKAPIKDVRKTDKEGIKRKVHPLVRREKSDKKN